MATRRQSASNASPADPGSATFGSTPLEGSLLIAIASERSGTSQSAFTISGSGWTKRVGRDVQLSDGDYRRTLVVWTKIAGASEPSTIDIDNGTANGKRVLIQEFELEAGENGFAFQAASVADNDLTENATSLSTGTTTTVIGAKFLSIGALMVKVKDVTAGAQTASWTNGLGNSADVGDADNNSQWLQSSYDGDDTSTSGYESTATYSADDTSNFGLIAAILVFALTPTVLGTPQNISTSLAGDNPSAFNVTVEEGTTAAVFQWAKWTSAGGGIASVTLNGAAPDVLNDIDVDEVFTNATATGTAVWYDPPSGTQALDVAWDTAHTEGAVGTFTCVGGGPVVVADIDSTHQTSANTPSVTLTGLTTGDLCLAFAQNFEATPTPSTGWSEIINGSNNSEHFSLQQLVADASSETADSNTGGANSFPSITAVAFTPDTSSPVTITGTATGTIDEDDVVAGGMTIIITLTDGDTFIAN